MKTTFAILLFSALSLWLVSCNKNDTDGIAEIAGTYEGDMLEIDSALQVRGTDNTIQDITFREFHIIYEVRKLNKGTFTFGVGSLIEPLKYSGLHYQFNLGGYVGHEADFVPREYKAYIRTRSERSSTFGSSPILYLHKQSSTMEAMKH